MNHMKLSLALAALILFSTKVVNAQLWSSMIDPGRAIDWTSAGVTGDIPTRSTICTTLSPGVTIATINSTIASCPSGQVVKLNAGTYSIASSIVMKSGVTLRGTGMGSTIIQGASGYTDQGLIGQSSSYDYYLTGQTSYDLVSPTRLTTTITTSTNHTWSAGDYIHIDQLEDISGSPKIQNLGSQSPNNSGSCRNPGATCRPLGQTVKIVSIPAANQAVIDTPLYWAYNQTPQATKSTGFMTGVGVEDLTLDNTTSQSIAILHMGGWYESWALRVELQGVVDYGIFMYGSVHDTVRSCLLHTGNSGSGSGYTIMLYNRATANLLEDNIVHDLGIVVLMDGNVAGNVLAYNYATNMIYGGVTAAGTGFGTHAAHPFYNLFEGNQIVTRFRFDYTFGTSSHNTVFRNSVVNEGSPVTSIRNLIDLWAYQTSVNVIGNVLGTIGQETIYAETSGAVHDAAEVVYAFGETTSFGDRGADGGAALSTVYRQGNWDSVNNAVRWDEDIVNGTRTLPSSFYLSSKPAYFGSCIWPPIGSDLTPMTSSIPAKLRFLANPLSTSANCGGGSKHHHSTLGGNSTAQ